MLKVVGGALVVMAVLVPTAASADPAPQRLADPLDVRMDLSGVRQTGIFLPIPADMPRPPPTSIYAPGGPPLPVFLNRNGGTYYRGQDDSATNRSTIPDSSQVTVSGYQGGDAGWSQVMSCVRDQFARFNVEITDVEPTRAHVEAVVGGRPSQVGLPNGVGGVAPIDPYGCDIISTAIVFIFSDVVQSDPQTTCEIVAQEVAHAFSLDHELLCEDPMTYLSGCGNKTFQDIDAQCGEGSPRQCICNRQRQNSVRIMLEKLGANTGGGGTTGDVTPPQVTLVSPQNGGTAPANSQIQVVAQGTDDTGIAGMDLVWLYNNNTFPCPTSGQSVSCTLNNGTATWTLNVGTGTRQFQVRARDTAGNQSMTPLASITLQEGGTATGDTTPPTVSIVRPGMGATLPANTGIEIEANATDDSGLSRVELVWAFTGDVFGCPSARTDVTCVPNGSRYAWSFNVGMGQRSFSVRATDVAGHVTETPQVTVTLQDGATQGDTTAPEVSIMRPSDGATFASGAAVEIVAAATDNVGITLAELVWGDGGDVFPCPVDRPDVTCSTTGGTYTWRLTPTDGTVSFRVRVTDGAGNQSVAGPRSLTVSGNSGTNPGSSSSGGTGSSGGSNSGDDGAEPNNTTAQATTLACGHRAIYTALDADYFVIEAGTDDRLEARVITDQGVTSEWVGADGAVLASGTDARDGLVITVPTAGPYYLRVTPAGTPGAEYALAIDCNTEEPSTVPGVPALGCTQAPVELPALAVMVLAVRGLRRRR